MDKGIQQAMIERLKLEAEIANLNAKFKEASDAHREAIAVRRKRMAELFQEINAGAIQLRLF
jgi:hypothetical protein